MAALGSSPALNDNLLVLIFGNPIHSKYTNKFLKKTCKITTFLIPLRKETKNTFKVSD
jgi:hypothetical protein